MDTMMKLKQAGMEKITIRCRNNPNWIRISVLTLAYTVISWLFFGLFCTLADGCLGFWQALITPIAVIFAAMDCVANFVNVRNKDTGRE